MLDQLLRLSLAAAIGLVSSTAVWATEPQQSDAKEAVPAAKPGKEASIPFANRVIHNWHVLDRNTLLIEVRTNELYRAEMFSPCHRLPFAQTIGFIPEPGGSLNRHSSIVVDGEICRFKSLTRASPPDGPKGKQRKPSSDRPEQSVKPAAQQ